MFRLTDEEIMSHIRDIYPEEIPFGVFALVTESIQAQLKKVVELFGKPCYEHLSPMGGLPVAKHSCEVCWQSLKKEAGL